MGKRRKPLKTPSFLERRFVLAFGVVAVFAGVVLRGLTGLVGEGEGHPPPQARALLPTERAGSPTPTLVPSSPAVVPDQPRRSSPPPSSKPTKRPAPEAKVNVEFPEPGQEFPEDRDFVVGGTARDLGHDVLRVFIFAEKRHRFYLADYRAERVGDEQWEIRSAGIGIEWGGQGDPYLVQVVRANGQCQKTLEGLELGNDHYPTFDALPEGCQVAAQVRVVEAD
ncbi:hypothetical protein ACGFNU_10580 [Spirillospora sp. NPDC048911]|uniref:hypothetical protein n=1 Tax=Spirillospora sp. NPDC048911 TaxID=3364527 RepID=UPI0037162353